MSREGFEPTAAVLERTETVHALDRGVAVPWARPQKELISCVVQGAAFSFKRALHLLSGKKKQLTRLLSARMLYC
jgi:hypothetical protein